MLPEHWLLHIWNSQFLNTLDLKTTDGRKVEIVRRGRWNFDTGPDFKSALLRIGNQLRQGDIEFHRKTSDWYAHRHERDSHYNNVILHGVYWEDLGNPVVRQDHQEVPTLVLSPYIKTQDLEDVYKSLESRACCLPEVKTLSQERLVELIEEKADSRFQKKIQRFATRYKNPDWDQLIYEGFLEALGYPINKKPFLKLAQRIPLKSIQNIIPQSQKENRALWIQAILLGIAGLLPASINSQDETSDVKNFDPETEAYLEEVSSLWEMLKPCFRDSSMQPKEWQFFRIRPLNSPTNRLARFSFLLAARTSTSWITEYVNFLMTSDEKTDWPETVKKLESSLLVPISGYWKHHISFGARSLSPRHANRGNRNSTQPIQFAIGRHTAREIVINVLLPILYLYAEKTSRTNLREKIVWLYKIYPAPICNRVTKFMIESLFKENPVELEHLGSSESSLRDVPTAQVIHRARTHQGLIQLHTELCHMKDCPSCPYQTR